eukprot:jgi/Psemu1/7170/gm1.7170_g
MNGSLGGKKAAAGMKKDHLLVAAVVKAKDDAPAGALEWSKEVDGTELEVVREVGVQTIKKKVTPEMLEIADLDDGKIEYIKRMQATRVKQEPMWGLDMAAV